MSKPSSQFWTCSRCLLQAKRLRGGASKVLRFDHRAITRSDRTISSTSFVADEKPSSSTESQGSAQSEQEKGAMSRRLADMAEETMDTGSRSDRKLMKEAGFSEELKSQLEQRIAQTSFNAENQQAISQVTMPTSAGRGTRDMAAAEPWTGVETLHDSALRMLDDSHKRLRSPNRPPTLGAKVSLRPAPKPKVSAANRLASARDRTSRYSISQQDDLSEEEREKYRKELKDRFSPGARPMPTSLQGLTSLANERIEDAIARGQFKNISRGKGINVERDYNANSPFLDTTEYFMNKIIQKQDIVPPWIEKQQELVKAVATFRGRMRNDWRRHAARLISSSGGSVESQVRRAKAYALTEEIVNPRVRKVESLNSIAPDGSLTSVTVEERIAAGVPVESSESSGTATLPGSQAEQPQEVVQIEVTEQPAEAAPDTVTEGSTIDAESPTTKGVEEPAAPVPNTTSTSPPPPSPSTSQQPQPRPLRPAAYAFRDPDWEKAELAYHTLAVQQLNDLTRSYNLMAPKIAQKPYYTLERELKRCFADVAPTLADEILERSRKPLVKISVMPHQEGGVLERFGAGEKYHGHHGRIRDEVHGKEYGFRQFWRDLFGGGGDGKENRRQVA